jgi:hypothetical protein
MLHVSSYHADEPCGLFESSCVVSLPSLVPNGSGYLELLKPGGCPPLRYRRSYGLHFRLMNPSLVGVSNLLEETSTYQNYPFPRRHLRS